MRHLKSYKIYEMNMEPETKELTFFKFVDKMSHDDSVKMNKLLERDPRGWSDDDKKFMKRMSLKDIDLYVDKDGKRYTEDELIAMGYDPKTVGKEISRPKYNVEDLRYLIKSYDDVIKQTNGFMTKNNEAYNISKILQPAVKNLGSIVYELRKNL